MGGQIRLCIWNVNDLRVYAQIFTYRDTALDEGTSQGSRLFESRRRMQYSGLNASVVPARLK
jgi:hypothetical protein